MNGLVRIGTPSLAAMTETELISVLQGSLYPGAKPESIKLVIGYCRAGGYDPMLKPVHIVPMQVKTGQKNKYGDDEYETRDVIMPGVGLYRTQAARTGEYAGVSEPEFGPTQKIAYKGVEWVDSGEKRPDGKAKNVKKFFDAEITYPEWCKVTVRRLVQGHLVDFWAREYWLENYTPAGKSSTAPNAMWKKRPYGQLAKCAEAQALRKGFPEAGAEPTADEITGKSLDDGVDTINHDTGEIDGKPKQVEGPKAKSTPQPQENSDYGAPPIVATDKPKEENGTSKLITPGGVRILKAKLKGYAGVKAITEEDATKQLLSVITAESLEALTTQQANQAADWLLAEIEK